ncbi:hypothetical protein [Streptomyces sp. NPDC127197]|uniref:hypothetical protein n=1 Tax=Streptomyces sp. NPDC127197 TaxID=3345388 RepID=UPI003632400B
MSAQSDKGEKKGPPRRTRKMGGTSGALKDPTAPVAHAGGKKIAKTTLDLDPQLHQKVRIWAIENGTSMVEVFRALGAELVKYPNLDDDFPEEWDLSQRVKDRIRRAEVERDAARPRFT